MALSDILDKILEEALEEAGAIRDRAQAEYEKARFDAEREAAILKEDILRKGELKVRRTLENELSGKRLEAKKDLLSLKRRVLSSLFAGLPPVLQEGSPDEYVGFLVGLAGGEPEDVRLEVEVGVKDMEKFGSGFAELVAGEFARRFPDRKVKVASRPGSFKWGLMIRAGRVEHNLTLEALLAAARKDMEGRVAGLLFAP